MQLSFETPTKPRGAPPEHAQHYEAARGTPSPAPSSALSMGHAAPTPASAAPQGLQALNARWSSLSASMKGHSQTAAELLMHQAATAAQVEDVVKQLLWEVKLHEEERQRLEAQILQDRADFTSQAKLLSQHFTTAHHRNTALQVAHEAQQGELKLAREELEAAVKNVDSLQRQCDSVSRELAEERRMRAEAESALHEHGDAIEQMAQELQHSRACCEELHAAKAQLQAQVKAMVKAERELTENLKHTHQQIDEQLTTLREQLQAERHKRMAANRRKAELSHHVALLTSQLESCQAALEQAHGEAESPGQQSSPPPASIRQIPSHLKLLPPGLRASLARRKAAHVRVAGAGQKGLKAPTRYTAAFAPPSARLTQPAADSRRSTATTTPLTPPGTSPMQGLVSPALSGQRLLPVPAKLPTLQPVASNSSPSAVLNAAEVTPTRGHDGNSPLA